ncbi:outer membrane beta-barrel protein [Labilibacter marinus]|uniref:outer membrane beta-barrel protein n=1 Tax=Labilibacter marinus TaxID=1477105 RepID=UPI00094FDE33|nr:outer membrane beta-barrel protein [Labilibacter marinus]
MKKLLFVVALIAAVVTTSNAQGWKYGGGLTLGTEVSIDDDLSGKLGFGLNLRGDYSFNEKWSIAPGFTFFFPSAPGDLKYTLWQLNTDAHYNFLSEETYSLYGLGGLNYTYAKVEDFDDSEVGLNIGAGINFGSKFFGELKYDTAFDQLGITVGVLFGGK